MVGVAQNDYTVIAERIELLPSGAKIPPANDNEDELEQEDLEAPTPQIEEDSGEKSAGEAIIIQPTSTSKIDPENNVSVGGDITSDDNKEKDGGKTKNEGKDDHSGDEDHGND